MNTADIQNLPRSMTVTAAAAFAERSASWVRRYRRFGPLVPDEIDGEQAVTTASLLALLRRSRKVVRKPRPCLHVVSSGLEPMRNGACVLDSTTIGGWPRLVVDNT
jgi:hypothetical protein